MDAHGTQRIAVLIPAYNNAAVLAQIVEDTLRQIDAVLVVDDGSTDGTARVLDPFRGRIHVHSHGRNYGKGASLREGFGILGEMGFTHAISMDADGQHFPQEIELFVEAILKTPRALVVGQRNMKEAGAFKRSVLGLWCSNLAVRGLTGVRLADSQSGFRAYPLAELRRLKLEGSRYDLELEVLIKAARAGLPFVSIPIHCSYSFSQGKISHFRPLVDSFRIGFQVGRLGLLG